MNDETKRSTETTHANAGGAPTVRGVFGVGMASLAIFLFASIALAQHEQHGRIARQEAETQREGSAPGPAARRGEPTSFDEGAAMGVLEGRLLEASRACDARLKPDTQLTVRATFDPSGTVLRADVLTDVGNPATDACLAKVLGDSEVPRYVGAPETVERTLTLYPH